MGNNFILSNGIEIPAIGMGTYPLNGEILKNAVFDAYCTGYHLFDTADNYYNEEDLGVSLNQLYKKRSVRRSELFLVSKLSDELYRPGTLGGGSNRGIYFWKKSPFMQEKDAVRKIVQKKLDNSLKLLQTDYLDLLLMHWPYPDFFEEIWYEMENLYQKGIVRAIGVCNCRERHFERLKNSCRIFPMVNQFESSPVNTKNNLTEYCRLHNVHVMIYSPLMNLRLKTSVVYKNYIQELANKYNKEVAQIILRFDIQRGFTPIPKSAHKERLKSNISVFDFELEYEEMEKLFSFNEDRQYMPESKSCPGL